MRQLTSVATLFVYLACHASGITAAEEDSVAKALGLTAEQGSLPVWAKSTDQARRELGTFARSANQGVMLVGHPDQGTGTAWVLSKKYRLLATNAHVADIMHDAGGTMFAVLNGSATRYKVERSWYHPGVRRRLKGGVQSMRTENPGDGPIDPFCPDVAVLQLSNEGPELPVELEMAGPDAFQSLFAQPAAILGYPGHDTASWPAESESAEATFHDGVVSRLTNFQNSVSCPPEEKQFLQYTMSTWGGFSGSPILLTSGEVIALHNSAVKAEAKSHADDKSPQVKWIPHGVRIDCLWELLVHHNLTDKVPIPVEKATVNVARWLQDDPRDVALRQAIALVEEAGRLNFVQDYAGGAKKCTEAIELAPNYAPAFQLRSKCFADYVATYRNQLSSEQRTKQLENADRDMKRAIQLNPSDPEIALELAGNLIVAAVVLDNVELENRLTFCRDAVTISEQVMRVEGNDYARALAYSVRAAANDGLGRYDQAERDHNEAIRLMPEVPGFYWSRSEYWRTRGRPDLQQKDLAMEKKLRRQTRPSLDDDLKALTAGRTETWSLTEADAAGRDLRLILQRSGFAGTDHSGAINVVTPSFVSVKFTFKHEEHDGKRLLKVVGKEFEKDGADPIITYTMEGDLLTIKSGAIVVPSLGVVKLKGAWQRVK